MAASASNTLCQDAVGTVAGRCYRSTRIVGDDNSVPGTAAPGGTAYGNASLETAGCRPTPVASATPDALDKDSSRTPFGRGKGPIVCNGHSTAVSPPSAAAADGDDPA